jgi:hypothetical protein
MPSLLAPWTGSTEAVSAAAVSGLPHGDHPELVVAGALEVDDSIGDERDRLSGVPVDLLLFGAIDVDSPEFVVGATEVDNVVNDERRAQGGVPIDLLLFGAVDVDPPELGVAGATEVDDVVIDERRGLRRCGTALSMSWCRSSTAPSRW